MTLPNSRRPRKRALVALATLTASAGSVNATVASPASAAPVNSADCVIVRNGSVITIYPGNGSAYLLQCVDGVLVRIEAPSS